MSFKFEPNQEHQVAAVRAVVDLFEGQPRAELGLEFDMSGGYAIVANRLDIGEDQILENLAVVQAENELEGDTALSYIEDEIPTVGGAQVTRFPNFSVEMETGTGKTYVYIRTMLDLYKRYGFRKFIVVVPSVAVREGVKADLEGTRSHFEQLFGSLPFRATVYKSENLGLIRSFALSDGIEVLVMTIDSFNRESNVIRQPADRLNGDVPLHVIQATRPILILDEPQKMQSELRIKALAALNPLFALRFSATHNDHHNLLYRLTPYDAYRAGLVKKIQVASFTTEDENRPFIRVDAVERKGRALRARITFHKLMADGRVKEKAAILNLGASLEEKSGRSEYAGYEVSEIDLGSKLVRFANGADVAEGAAVGTTREDLFEAQIRFTIAEHMDKQERLRSHGVKVLSLFFIDRVASYQDEDGIVRAIFDRAFNEEKVKYETWSNLRPEDVRRAYFAERRRRSGEKEAIDTTGASDADEDAYDLILRKKEELLSFEQPVCFIFSHSALAEGWDNPNIFQICTLRQTASAMRKRQEVGRGVRLARNQALDRVTDPSVNVLTVVASESYQRYVSQLQQEIEDEYGKDGIPPTPGNARERGTATLRKNFVLSDDFKALWERIKHRTRYRIEIDTAALLDEVVPEVDKISVRPPRISVVKARVEIGETNDMEALRMSAAKTLVDLRGRYALPNLVSMMKDSLEGTTPPVRLTRRTLLELFKRTENKQSALENPHEFASKASAILKEKLADQLVRGIRYQQTGEWYDMLAILDEPTIETWMSYLVPAAKATYDYITCESNVEREFVACLEKTDPVKLYCKLPGWFKVPTPVGNYNPDWAIVWEDRDEHGNASGEKLYLVRETKADNWRKALRPNERRKIEFGKAHFQQLGADYEVISTCDQLPHS